jgi:hypothetical protein
LGGDSAAIHVYAFADDNGQPLDDENTTSACSRLGYLQLPRPRSPARLGAVSFFQNALSACRLPSVSQELFGASQKDRLFVLYFNTESALDIVCRGCIFIPEQTLRHHILRMTQAMQQSRQNLSIPWMDWGPNGSHLSYDEDVDYTWKCIACGSRVITSAIHSTRGGEDGSARYNISIILRDFSPRAVRKIMAADDFPNDTSPGTSWAQSTSWQVDNQQENVDWFSSYREYDTVSEYFEDDVSTRLPYLYTSKTLRQPLESRDGHSAMLTENTILVVHDGDVRLSTTSMHSP